MTETKPPQTDSDASTDPGAETGRAAEGSKSVCARWFCSWSPFKVALLVVVPMFVILALIALVASETHDHTHEDHHHSHWVPAGTHSGTHLPRHNHSGDHAKSFSKNRSEAEERHSYLRSRFEDWFDGKTAPRGAYGKDEDNSSHREAGTDTFNLGADRTDTGQLEDQIYNLCLSGEYGVGSEAAVKAALEAAEPLAETLGVTRPSAESLAIAYGYCNIGPVEIQGLLDEGELGRQYRTLVQAMDADTYLDFLDVHRAQPCLVAAGQGERVQSEYDISRHIEAVDTAALLKFRPSDEEMEQLTERLLGELFDLLTGDTANIIEDARWEWSRTCEQITEEHLADSTNQEGGIVTRS